MKFEIFSGKDGQTYWRLKARNGRILCHSEGYKRWQSAYDAMMLVRAYASDAIIYDRVKHSPSPRPTTPTR